MLRITSKIKPVVLLILDGWGVAADSNGNAITRARPQSFNSLWFSYPHTYLTSWGLGVGLPEGQAGNSEVGHQNLGAGKIVFQDELRINSSINDGDFFQNKALLAAISHAKKNDSKINLLGLISPGSVHSNINHFFALLELIKKSEIPSSRVMLHLFLDGRDSPPKTAKIFLSQVLEKLWNQKLGNIASICGRYYAMDRDNRWERTEQAYLCLIGKTNLTGKDPIKIIEESYEKGVTDEFIKPHLIVDSFGKPIGSIAKGDSIIFFNYRQDRARQLTRAFVDSDFKSAKTTSGEFVGTFNRGPKLENIFFVTLTQYEKDLPVSAVAFTPDEVLMPIGRVFSERNLRQFHIAETEKYAHVTYFFNGGREEPFPGEDRLLIASQKVASYDLKPEMSTPEITKKVVSHINTRIYDFMVVNLANPDMVAHTGNFDASVSAIKDADLALSIIARSALSTGGAIIITSDHGNAEQMINPKTKEVDTEHNCNPSPLIIAAEEFHGKTIQLPKGILADVAPTILAMVGITKPSQMTGSNLLE